MKESDNSIITASGLHFSYGNKKVLKGVSLSLNDGEILGIIGESGSGKTSLMKILAGILAPKKGLMAYAGVPYENPDHQLIAGHAKIKLVNQDFDLAPYLSVRSNMLRNALSESDTARQKILRYYERQLQLNKIRDNRATDTSGGQQQRIALAAALGANPEVLLLDEPFSNLDYPLKQHLIKLLKTEWRPKSMVVVTHEPNDILQMADRILVMEAGKIGQEGSPEDVYNYPKTESIAQLLGPINVLSTEEAKIFGPPGSTYIRPHQIKVARTGVGAVVDSCQFVGNRFELSLSVRGRSHALLVEAPRSYRKGAKLKLALKS